MARRITTAGLVILFLSLSSSAAYAHLHHHVDDGCSRTQTQYFFPGGPPSGWGIHSGAGVNGCHMFTGTTDLTTVNHASWYLPLQSGYNHDFFVHQYIVGDSHCNSRSANYERYRNGTINGVTERYRWNMSAVQNAMKRITEVNGPPNYDHFNATNGGYMKMIDKTGEMDRHVCADYMWYEPKPH